MLRPFLYQSSRSLLARPKHLKFTFSSAAAGGGGSNISTSKDYSHLDNRRVTLSGTIQRVVYRSPDSMYSILSVRPKDHQGQDVTVQGKGATMGQLYEGQDLEVEGTLKTHKKYGIQLEVSETDATRNNAALSKAAKERYQDLEKDADSVRDYLKNGFIPQVGPQTADRLVNHFGSDTAEALLSAKKLMAVNGIGKMKAKVISDHWKRDTESGVRPTIMYLLTEFNLSFSQAKTLLTRYGVAAPDLVKRNPYRLIDDIHGVGFSRADEIARRMGMPIRSTERLRCGITHHLTATSAANGHTCMSVEDVVRGVAPLLSVREEAYMPDSAEIVDAIDSLEKMGKIHVGHGDMVYASAMYKAETTLASALRDIVVGDHHTKRMEEQIMQASDLEEETDLMGREEKALLSVGNENGGENGGENGEEDGDNSAILASEQKRAVALSKTEQLLVLTGGPGTGKTFTTRSILRQWWSMGLENIVLTSPTARAARHLGKVATEGRPEGVKRPSAMTIHKLLEYSKHQNRFLRTSKRPIDAEAVVVDESSMLDTHLAASLFSAMRPGTRVLIVGDADQLPSVGPGNVLRDLVSSDTLPVVRLQQIYRQEEAGGIVRSAHLMNRGDLPIVSGAMRAIRPRDLREMIGKSVVASEVVDCLWVEEMDSRKGASLICKDIMDYVEARGFSASKDVQVLAPMHKGNAGTIQLNRAMRARLNPDAAKKGRDLDVGDRCMQETNNYDLHVWNGECGTVVQRRNGGALLVELENGVEDVDEDDEDVDTKRGAATTVGERLQDSGTNDSASSPPYRHVEFSFKQSRSLALAYACTIHKSQGQEFPVVIVPMYSEHYHMLSRELVYTALTRASQLVIFVGQRKALSGALRHQSAFNRTTGLVRHLIPDKVERVSVDAWRSQHLNGKTHVVSKDIKSEFVDLWNDLDLESMVELDEVVKGGVGGWERGEGGEKESVVVVGEAEGEEEEEEEGKGGEVDNSEVDNNQNQKSASGPWIFSSSKDDSVLYTTTETSSASGLTCDCPGFKYRKTCKHVQEIQTFLISK